MRKLSIVGTLITLMGGALVSNADIYSDLSPGTAAPPGTLGGYSMVGFPPESQPEGTPVTTVAAPGGATLTFDQEVLVANVPSSWSTWSHGYSGTVYDAEFISGTALTLTLPASTLAFYLYVEPNSVGAYDFTATCGHASTTLSIPGNAGARYVGFYSDTAGDFLTSITVDQPDGMALGYAVGEFGINGVPSVPEAGSCLNILAALGSLGLFGWRGRRK